MSELVAKYDDVKLDNISLVSNFVVRILDKNSVILFYGDLGSGKTTLCSSIIKTFFSEKGAIKSGQGLIKNNSAKNCVEINSLSQKNLLQSEIMHDDKHYDYAADKVECALVDEIEVTSPTFNILHTYQFNDSILINHYDLYRIESMQELLELGFFDSLLNSITLIEWPKFLRDYFIDNQFCANVLEVCIDYKENSRDFLIKRLGKS